MITVLITGCSKHSKEVIDVLKNNYDNEEIKVVGIDCNEKNLMKRNVDVTYVVPRIDDKKYIDTLLEICIKEKVDVIFPYITKELNILAENICRFKRHNIKVSVSSLESLKIANDKIELYKRYKRFMPNQKEIKSLDEFTEYVFDYGVVTNSKYCCKLPDSCGGIGFVILDNEKAKDITLINKAGVPNYTTYENMMDMIEKYKNPIIVQEFVKGIDYSVCLLADKGTTLYIQGFEIYSMVNGAEVNGKIKDIEKAYRIAKKIVSELQLDGNICFDFIIAESNVYLLEINPRLSASLPFICKAGLNLIYLRLMQLLGKDIKQYKIEVNKELEMHKFYDSEYF